MKMKLVLLAISSLFLTACSNGIELSKEDYEISTAPYEESNASYNFSRLESSIAFELYDNTLNNYFYNFYNKITSSTLRGHYKIIYKDKIGKLQNDETYEMTEYLNNMGIACSNIKFEKGDIQESKKESFSGSVFFKNQLSWWDYDLSLHKTAEIESCADNYMKNSGLPVNVVSRFLADDRFSTYDDGELETLLSEIKKDGKITFFEFLSAYKLLDKKIEATINSKVNAKSKKD